MATEYLNPNDLIFIQSRAESDPALVDEYAAMMEDGVGFDPVQAVSDGSHVYVWDGYHRGEAAKRLGKALFVAVKPGSKDEAEWLALSANQKHGLRRSNADKQKAVRAALQHPRGAQMSNRQIAIHCGVSHVLVNQIREKLEVTGNISSQIERTGADGRTIDTANIGGKALTPALSQGERGPENPYAVTECPRCGEKKIVIFPRLNRVNCENCGRVWNTILSYHVDRQLKFEEKQAAALFPQPGPGAPVAEQPPKISPKDKEQQLVALEKAAGGPDEARQALEIEERERILAECGRYFNQIVDTATLPDLEVMRAWLEDFYMDGL